MRNIIGIDLHHNPGTGEEGDEVKFKEAYLQTKESYKKFFGYYPPQSIWDSWHKPKEGKKDLPWYKVLFINILKVA